MRKLKSNSIGVAQGDVVLFSHYETDGEMWTGEGTRQIRTHVAFSESFIEPPTVHVGPSMWDLAHSANARIDLQIEDVDRDGFFILFRTWEDTQIARLRVSWMAVGPAHDDELWDLG